MFVLVGQFGNGSGFAYAVYAYYKDDVGFVGEGSVEVLGKQAVVLAQEGGNLCP